MPEGPENPRQEEVLPMREKRVNPETGVLEEKHWTGWEPARNAEGREERVNPKTGVREEKRWTGWTPVGS